MTIKWRRYLLKSSGVEAIYMYCWKGSATLSCVLYTCTLYIPSRGNNLGKLALHVNYRLPQHPHNIVDPLVGLGMWQNNTVVFKEWIGWWRMTVALLSFIFLWSLSVVGKLQYPIWNFRSPKRTSERYDKQQVSHTGLSHDNDVLFAQIMFPAWLIMPPRLCASGNAVCRKWTVVCW